MTESELIKGCINNDRRCQELLYKKHFPAMLRMVRRYADSDDVCLEIINSGFLKVFKGVHTFQQSGSLEGWIRRVIFRALSDYFRQSKQRIQFLELEDRDQPKAPIAISNLYLEDLMNLVKSLPESSQRVFVLYAIEGYNHREIGTLLNISEGTSKWHLSNARKALRGLLNQNENQSFSQVQHY